MDKKNILIPLESIIEASKMRDAQRRMERIQIIREEINAFLEESLHDAEITGELSKLKRGKMFKIPSYFRLPNGVYEFPEELLKELKEAGYSFQQGVGKENEIYYIFACRE